MTKVITIFLLSILGGSLPKSVPLDLGLDKTFALYFCHQYYYPFSKVAPKSDLKTCFS